MRQVDYQKDQPDRFHHQYVYDADNRITEVKSSADGADWHRDARYFYYPHGPLARVELGEHLVQGTDYAYTLQGWLKGINGDRLNPNTDMGRDGDPTVTSNPNLLAGRDAFSMSLGYYGDTDYKAIGNVWNTVTERPFAPIGTSGTTNTLADSHMPLYNGNIAHTVNTLQPFGLWDATNGSQGQVLAQVYRYDQLNRLKKARGFTGINSGNTWVGVVDAAEDRYRSQYEYDANGNITSAERWNEDGTDHYDSFVYHYQQSDNRTVRNRLYELFDNATVTLGTDIVATPGTFDNDPQDVNTNNNYGYDALGNLVRDTRAHIEAIDWTVAGKVKRVTHETGEGPGLEFAYGASGQRTLKQVSDPDSDEEGYREHYIRDAQGNIMATYRYKLIPVPNTTPQEYYASLKLNERPLYGSSRLGSLRKEVELHSEPFDPEAANPVQAIDLNYELTDHLGNVCAVVTGRLLDGNGGGTPKQAELLSAQGYEPFGSLLPGRNYSSNSYNYGFNGKLKDDEVHGATGTIYDYGFRIYDPRLARFLSVDPLTGSFPFYTPYQFAGNNPIKFIDLDGCEQAPNQGDYHKQLRSFNPTEWLKREVGHYFGIVPEPDGDTRDEYRKDVERYMMEMERAKLKAQHATDVLNLVNTALAIVVPFSSVAVLCAETSNPHATVASIANAVFWVGVDAATMGTGKLAKADDVVDLYRAVSKAELDDIGKHGFRAEPSGRSMETKLFMDNLEDAIYQGIETGKDFFLVRVTVPRSTARMMEKGAAGTDGMCGQVLGATDEVMGCMNETIQRMEVAGVSGASKQAVEICR